MPHTTTMAAMSMMEYADWMFGLLLENPGVETTVWPVGVGRTVYVAHTTGLKDVTTSPAGHRSIMYALDELDGLCVFTRSTGASNGATVYILPLIGSITSYTNWNSTFLLDANNGFAGKENDTVFASTVNVDESAGPAIWS